MTHNTQASSKSVRLHYLDWLRVLAILGVFFFHAVHPFDMFPWEIKNAEQSLLVTLFIVYLAPWGMALFFFLSGASSWFALRRRTPRQYAIERHGWVCLALWLLGFFGALLVIVLVLGYDPMPGSEPFSLLHVLYQSVYSFASWSAVVFMLGLGAKYLNFNNKFLAYANEAVLPFYLLHQTVILCVGWFVIPWNLGILPKFLIVAVVSFALIMAIYELLIKRFNIVRFFFGMRSRKVQAPAPAPSPEKTTA